MPVIPPPKLAPALPGESARPAPNNEHNPPTAATIEMNETDKQNGEPSPLPPPTSFSNHGSPNNAANTAPGFRVSASGESGRRGIHPWHFLRIVFKSTSTASTLCNLLWPFVPAALALRYTLPDHHLLVFSFAYVAMIPCANLIGFAGQELARKLPHVLGVLVEVFCGGTVEIILLAVLVTLDEFYVIKAAILGSILATMLLCLGMCFLVGGIRRTEQTFNDTISETGHGLLFTAGVTLAVPTVFALGLTGHDISDEDLSRRTLDISRVLSVLLIIANTVHVYFQARSHHGIYADIFRLDEERDIERHTVEADKKLTLTECILSLVVSIALVSLIAITLVLEIHHVVEVSVVSDPFIGLILVPLVEKFAEHLTAIDEAWNNQTNLAISHVLGATLATALFNAPLAVIIGWGLDKHMDLNFEVFNLVMLILSILTVGRFLQDQKSNYFEGFLLVILYIAIAVSAWYYPNPTFEE